MPKSPDTSSYKSLLRMRIPGAGEPVYKARARLAAVARRIGLSTEATDGVLLAFTEAVTNAIIYGKASRRHSVRVAVGLENGRLIIEVSDHGEGFHPDKIQLPPPGCMCEGGRGLFLMRALMDEVEWIPTPTGTTVCMSKCCVPAPPLPEPTHTKPSASVTPVPATN